MEKWIFWTWWLTAVLTVTITVFSVTVTPVGFTKTPWSIFFWILTPIWHMVLCDHSSTCTICCYYHKLCTKHLLTILAMCKWLSYVINSSLAGAVSTNYKCVIHVQFSQFYGWNCLDEFLEWPGSPPRTLLIIFKHENIWIVLAVGLYASEAACGKLWVCLKSSPEVL